MFQSLLEKQRHRTLEISHTLYANAKLFLDAINDARH
jgi:hypothetical protein